jgi:hypothetical protein
MKHRNHPIRWLTALPRGTRAILPALCLLAWSPCTVQAFFLDWDSVSWVPGVEETTYTDVAGSGVDITVSVSIAGGVFADFGGQPGPAINNRLGGDGGGAYNSGGDFVDDDGNPSPRSLFLHMNAETNNRLISYMDVVIRFTQAVQGVQFRIFDVDHGTSTPGNYTFDDVIERVSGSLDGNAVAATVTAGSDITTVPGLATPPAGTTTGYIGNGWLPDPPSAVLTLGWGTQFVDEVSFRYSSGNRARPDPSSQGIALSDIEFHPVPEARTVVMMGCLVGVLAILHMQRRRKTGGHPATGCAA